MALMNRYAGMVIAGPRLRSRGWSGSASLVVGWFSRCVGVLAAVVVVSFAVAAVPAAAQEGSPSYPDVASDAYYAPAVGALRGGGIFEGHRLRGRLLSGPAPLALADGRLDDARFGGGESALEG